MRSTTNWGQVKPSAGGEMLPVGGHVATITAAQDTNFKSGAGCLKVSFTVTEGDAANMTGEFMQGYEGKSEGMFRGFLDSVAASNPGKFSAETFANDERKLVGMKVGVIVQERYYTNDAGEDKTWTEVRRTEDVAKIRSGRFTLPKPRDQRTQTPGVSAAQEQAAAAYGSDVPF